MKHRTTRGAKCDTEAGLDLLIDRVAQRQPLAADAPVAALVSRCGERGTAIYSNTNARRQIDFQVERLPFPAMECLDPRIVRIAGGHANEHHRHAHETLLIVMTGCGEVRIGEQTVAVAGGDIVFVPRWAFHQTRNTDPTCDLVLLAVTDFGLTRAVLGDYDRSTRSGEGGDRAREPSNGRNESNESNESNEAG